MSPLPPLTADDLAALAFVSEAAISADGARVAYAVRRMDLDANRYRAALHVSSVDGSSAIAWTDGSVEDASPRWSPDSRAIAFVSDRGVVLEGKKRAPKNVFVVEGPGAEPRQITTFADDCGDLTWLPDGSIIDFDPIQTPSDRELTRAILGPGESRTLKLTTLPLNGSFYPVSLVVHAL